MSTPPHHWDASTYHRIDTPMRRWAETLLDEIEWRGDEVVLDAGCGSGVVTESLARRVPRGRVYAVDASPEMVARLRDHVTERGLSHVVPVEADLTRVAPIEPCDVIFSNAVFHWIDDWRALAQNLARWAKPGAHLRAQCGGVGNLARVHAASGLERESHVWFRSPDEARVIFDAAGWRDTRAWLVDAPALLGDRSASLEYLRTVILRVQVGALADEAARHEYLSGVYERYAERFGLPFVADYVRLNLASVRASELGNACK
jgi:trans-aconitate 2-methyltransferase